MFQREEMSYQGPGTAYSYAGDTRLEEEALSSRAGQKLSGEASGQAPSAVQRLALALVSLGMLMGMTILLTLVAVNTGASGWVAFPLLVVLTLFTTAAISINMMFNHGPW